MEEVREALEAVKEEDSEKLEDTEGEVRINQRVQSPRQPGEKPGPKAGSSAKRCEDKIKTHNDYKVRNIMAKTLMIYDKV